MTAVDHIDADPASPWDAFYAGKVAALAGRRLSELPYKIRNSPRYRLAWRKGWREGAAELAQQAEQAEAS
jgi:ribosome modulation factor